MITKVTTLTKLKQLFVEIFLNKTDKVSDISDNSVLNGVSFGVGKASQKALKDIAIVETRIFPKDSSGSDLDISANLFGVSRRKGAVGSSTYLRIIADSGTVYQQGTHEFISNVGLRFELEENFTMGATGIGYAKVRCTDIGARTNIDAETIANVNPIPSGHIAVTNEYRATGGIDAEDDEVYRRRVLSNNNALSITTLSYFTQVFQNLDSRVLRLFNLGVNNEGKKEFAVVTQNGVNLTRSELDALLESAADFFSITEKNRFGDLIGIQLNNVQWYIVGGEDPNTGGIRFRVQFVDGADPVEVRRRIQINLSKYLDFRFWEVGRRVEWDRLLQIVQNTRGVRYVPDNFFSPSSDETVPVNRLPRIEGFRIMDLDGNILPASTDTLVPVFYPA